MQNISVIGFAFDETMRSFVAQGAGRTLGEAVAHWHATREEAARPSPIGAQFELNAFLRRRRSTHPGEGREAALAAWREYRSRPVDQRADDLTPPWCATAPGD